MTILKDIEKFLLTEIAGDLGRQSLDPDEDLLEQRIIDSMGILKLVVFLEKTNGIQVLDEDVIPENFQSLNRIVKLVEQKMKDK
jgi:acyl carrier protein